MAHADIDPRTGEAFSLVEFTAPLAVNAKTSIVDAFGRSADSEQRPGASTRAAAPGSKHVSANDSLTSATARRQRSAYANRPRQSSAAAQEGKFSPDGDVLRVLHAILPPREWLDRAGPEGTLYSQHVLDSVRPTRDDVLELEEMLDHELRARQARPATCIAVAATAAHQAKLQRQGVHDDDNAQAVLRHGCLCPVREALFSQVMDDLIRQATLLEPTRGLLLARMRDHCRLDLAAYASLAQAGVKYAADKSREAASSSPEDAHWASQLASAQDSNESLRRQVAQLSLLVDKTRQRHAAQRAAREAAHAAELQHLSQQNRILESFLQQAADARIDIGLPAAGSAPRG